MALPYFRKEKLSIDRCKRVEKEGRGGGRESYHEVKSSGLCGEREVGVVGDFVVSVELEVRTIVSEGGR